MAIKLITQLHIDKDDLEDMDDLEQEDAEFTVDILAEVLKERQRQDDLKGRRRDLSLFVWAALLSEENGEVSQAIVDLYSYTPGIKKDKTDRLIEELRTECLHTAAAAVAIVEAIDDERLKFSIPTYELRDRE